MDRHIIVVTDNTTGQLTAKIVDRNSYEAGIRLTAKQAEDLANEIILKVKELNAN